ncbi:MAG: hypothetical protein U5R31_04990 [Acidimicrobiia bacterium]|nr:hypothetical protein [Acidimicrobiia bacterium]
MLAALVAALVAGVLALAAPSTPAGASTFEVTDPSDSAVTPNTLRWAIDQASGDPTPPVIDIAAGLEIELTCAGGGALTYDSAGDLPLRIEGNGAVIRQTCAGDEVLNTANEELSIADATITGGTDGGIIGGGDTTLDGVTVEDNTGGPGISAYNGTATILRSTLRDNEGGSGGGVGAIYVEVEDSTLAGNDAERGGGAWADQWARVTNSTITGNTAELSGGGVYAGLNEIELTYATIVGNGAPEGANVHLAFSAQVESIASLIGEPGGGGANCEISPGASVVSGCNVTSDISCDLDGGPEDLIDTDPAVEPLADNGGPTPDPAARGRRPRPRPCRLLGRGHRRRPAWRRHARRARRATGARSRSSRPDRPPRPRRPTGTTAAARRHRPRRCRPRPPSPADPAAVDRLGRRQRARAPAGDCVVTPVGALASGERPAPVRRRPSRGRGRAGSRTSRRAGARRRGRRRCRSPRRSGRPAARCRRRRRCATRRRPRNRRRWRRRRARDRARRCRCRRRGAGRRTRCPGRSPTPRVRWCRPRPPGLAAFGLVALVLEVGDLFLELVDLLGEVLVGGAEVLDGALVALGAFELVAELSDLLGELVVAGLEVAGVGGEEDGAEADPMRIATAPVSATSQTGTNATSPTAPAAGPAGRCRRWAGLPPGWRCGWRRRAAAARPVAESVPAARAAWVGAGGRSSVGCSPGGGGGVLCWRVGSSPTGACPGGRSGPDPEVVAVAWSTWRSSRRRGATAVPSAPATEG